MSAMVRKAENKLRGREESKEESSSNERNEAKATKGVKGRREKGQSE